MNRSERLVRNTAILSFGTICTKALSFVMLPFFSRWLSTSEYGDFDLLSTYVTLLIPILTLSCGESLFRKLLDAKDDRRRKSITSTCVVILFLGLILLIVVSPIVLHFYNSTLTIPFISLAVSEFLYNFLMYYARGKRKLKYYALANIVFVCAMSLSVTIFVLTMHLGLNGIIYGYAIGYLLSAVILAFLTEINKECDYKTINRREVKEVLSYCAPLIPNTISWWVANVSDRTIITIVLGSSINGLYAMANKIPSICTALFSVFHLSWQETAVDSIDSKDRNVYFNGVYNSTCEIIISICVGVLSLNFFVFKYILDIKYFDARLHVPILMAAIIFSFLSQFIGGIFVGFEDSKVNGTTTVIAALVNIVVNISLIHVIGLYAASVSTLVSYVVLFFVRLNKMKEYMRLKLTNKSKMSVGIFGIFMLLQIVDNIYVHSISIVIAALFFSYTNKEMLEKVIGKIASKQRV